MVRVEFWGKVIGTNASNFSPFYSLFREQGREEGKGLFQAAKLHQHWGMGDGHLISPLMCSKGIVE